MFLPVRNSASNTKDVPPNSTSITLVLISVVKSDPPPPPLKDHSVIFLTKNN